MAVTLVASSGASIEQPSGTSAVLTVPGTWAANHVPTFFGFFGSAKTVTVSGPTLRLNTSWAGFETKAWTQLLGTPPASYTFSWTGNEYAAIVAVAFAGCDTSSADAHLITAAGGGSDPTANTGATDPATAPSVTVPSGRDGSVMVAHFVSGVGARDGTPAGMTNAITDFVNLYIDYEARNAGASGTRTTTYTPDQDWCAQSLGLQPAASGGGGETASVDHASVSSFPALCNRPENDNGHWIRGRGGLWEPRPRRIWSVPSRKAA